ncbi:hypothetical protein CRG98_008284 [Punica granatum]|uniref:Uncharacterized protein n=1 Tax=Punica granatum TaxID=22663 RepID=A0A2I0KS18_PUNGR|nr:hypothetical protein CRG98_008284 [Punica granatum]
MKKLVLFVEKNLEEEAEIYAELSTRVCAGWSDLIWRTIIRANSVAERLEEEEIIF